MAQRNARRVKKRIFRKIFIKLLFTLYVIFKRGNLNGFHNSLSV